MYVVMSEYLDGKNQNVLEIVSSIEEGEQVITDHFNSHYARHLSLEIIGNVGYVSGYKLGGKRGSLSYCKTI